MRSATSPDPAAYRVRDKAAVARRGPPSSAVLTN
jgi:hypothetical protein